MNKGQDAPRCVGRAENRRYEGQNSQRRGTEPGYERRVGCGPSDFLIKKVIQKSENLRKGKCSPVPGLKSLP